MSRYRRQNSYDDNRNRNRGIWIAGIVIVVAIALCSSSVVSGGMWVAGLFKGGNDQQQTDSAAPSWAPDSAELTIAASPLMAPVLQQMASSFNSLDLRTPDNKKETVWIVPVVPEKMVEDSLGMPNYQAISPDSSLWLDQLEQEWAKRQQSDSSSDTQIPIGQRRISGQTRYAVSPIVIAAWEPVARELGWPTRPIGWQEIQEKATQDANFKWNHSATNNASGLLATLAEFYAGAKLTRGLTVDAATDKKTLDYVQAVESTIKFYGEGEDVIVQHLQDQGEGFLDAFAAQERTVIDWNNRNPKKPLVAIYPSEGTLWTDHPLALLELGSQAHELAVTDNQRLTYGAFADFLTSADAQKQFLSLGFRPADLSLQLDGPGSPFANNSYVDWRQPQTTLQMPSPSVIDVVKNVWYYTKRPTNVYLVVDTSGSMEGTKLAKAQQALTAFVKQIQGDRDKLGLVEFASGTKTFLPLRVMDDKARADTLDTINKMTAFGGTALVDAVYAATADIIKQNDTSAINAIVVLTDGQENESTYKLNDLETLLSTAGDVRPVIFTVAFGNDADEGMLTEIARIGSGQFKRASETDIEELYRIISTYF